MHSQSKAELMGQGMWVFLGHSTVQKGFGFLRGSNSGHRERQSETLTTPLPPPQGGRPDLFLEGAMEPARKGKKGRGRKGKKTAQLREGRRDSREDAVEDCPVCLTAFDEIGRRPRTLPCGHTFCTPCVNGLKEQGRVTCPNCRVEHPVPEAGQFPVSYICENLLRRMRGASLASPPPCAEKDTAESAHSLGTRPGQQGQKGLSKRVRSLLEEQEAKILAAIHSCQKVKEQLNQYETTVRDWGREQQDLEVRLQALMDQCKDARVLARQEELSASDKRQQVDHGEQQLHTVLQAVRTAASAGEAIETIEDADHVMEEETQREEECLAMISDVHTVTTLNKATEVAQAALEAAATVQAAQQTAGVGGGAAGHASLPLAAAASSIRDRVDALMPPTLRSSLHPAPQSLQVEDLRSLTQHVRDLLQRGLVFAVHTTAGRSRQASLSLEDDRLYLHCLRDQPLPRGAVTLQTTEVAQAALEAAATVQAAQQTAGVGGGAAGDASLPAAAASSIRDRVDALMSPPLKVEDLRSLTQHARDLLQRGLVFAVHTTVGRSRQAKISLEDDRLYLHCLRDQPLPRCAITLQLDEVAAAAPPCRVFLELGWKGRPSRRVLIHLDTDTPMARQFLLLCTGQRGPSYNGSTLFAVGREGQPGEYVMGGDYEGKNGSGGAALLPDLDKGVYSESWMAGVVGGWCDGGPALGAQFRIITKDLPGRSVPCVIGKVEVGLDVVREAARHRPITEVTVVDCGVVVD
ncbi:Peptidyl-prolyl cis-trans isomerase CYP18-4 [Chionoecetes opilio]|uniref:Peptidyl-prolyl cis-trans isomerase CYP18-4 n=1 Tax=Chionoecetes opilio TaxID=41210 RepID=A0A8J4Z0J5_CHIOP|nr:Peptidyl-prolyl cis-trans isomerase CYP18-4 [Chionoecetes opilio]